MTWDTLNVIRGHFGQLASHRIGGGHRETTDIIVRIKKRSCTTSGKTETRHAVLIRTNTEWMLVYNVLSVKARCLKFHAASIDDGQFLTRGLMGLPHGADEHKQRDGLLWVCLASVKLMTP